MSELAELYAACIIEYATRQPNGLLTASSDVFGSDVCRAYKLPYTKKSIDDACLLLKKMQVLTEHRHANVPIHYSVRRSIFDNAMIVEGNGDRRYKTFLSMSASAAVASSIQMLSGFQKQPSPTLLESYADLGTDYLRQILKSFEAELAQIGADEIGSEDQRQSPNAKIPASDRMVTLSDNQQSELEDVSSELILEVEKSNGIDGDSTFRQIVLGQLKAGRELIRAKIFDAQIMYLTLVEILKTLVNRYDQAIIGSLAGSLLVELAKIHGLLS